jgi:hypothetical protein
MKLISGTFLFDDARATYLCLGAIPDFIRIFPSGLPSLADAQVLYFEQNFLLGATGTGGHPGGRLVAETGDDLLITAAAVGSGIEMYNGGTMLTAALQDSATYGGTGPYFGFDPVYGDYRVRGASNTSAPPANYTNTGTRDGKFDNPVSSTYIGVGSRVLIESPNGDGSAQWYRITEFTTDGDANDDLEFDRNCADGRVLQITGMYSMIPLAVGKVTLPGVKINSSLGLVDATRVAFEAGWYDNM